MPQTINSGMAIVSNTVGNNARIRIQIKKGGCGAMPRYYVEDAEVWIRARISVGRVSANVVFFRQELAGLYVWAPRLHKIVLAYEIDDERTYGYTETYAGDFALVAEACGMGKDCEVGTGRWFAAYMIKSAQVEFDLVADKIASNSLVEFPCKPFFISPEVIREIKTEILRVDRNYGATNVWAALSIGDVRKEILFEEEHYPDEYNAHFIHVGDLGGPKQTRALARLACVAGLCDNGFSQEEAAEAFASHYNRVHAAELQLIFDFADASR